MLYVRVILDDMGRRHIFCDIKSASLPFSSWSMKDNLSRWLQEVTSLPIHHIKVIRLEKIGVLE